jgi:hypothetical protein
MLIIEIKITPHYNLLGATSFSNKKRDPYYKLVTSFYLMRVRILALILFDLSFYIL